MMALQDKVTAMNNLLQSMASSQVNVVGSLYIRWQNMRMKYITCDVATCITPMRAHLIMRQTHTSSTTHTLTLTNQVGGITPTLGGEDQLKSQRRQDRHRDQCSEALVYHQRHHHNRPHYSPP